jgi:hypothetical protein
MLCPRGGPALGKRRVCWLTALDADLEAPKSFEAVGQQSNRKAAKWNIWNNS